MQIFCTYDKNTKGLRAAFTNPTELDKYLNAHPWAGCSEITLYETFLEQQTAENRARTLRALAKLTPEELTLVQDYFGVRE